MKNIVAAFLGAALITCMSAAFGAGDAAIGKALYDSRCAGCHSVDQNRIGPAHQDVFGRKAGGAPG